MMVSQVLEIWEPGAGTDCVPGARWLRCCGVGRRSHAAGRSRGEGSSTSKPMASDGLEDFGTQIADQVASFLMPARAVASGDPSDSNSPVLLLETSQLLLAGGRLGAIEDVVPDERFAADAGSGPDFNELRAKLAALLKPVNSYKAVFDLLASKTEVENRRISDDLALVCADLTHGLMRYSPAARTTYRPPHPEMVGLAPTTPGHLPAMPLPPTTNPQLRGTILAGVLAVAHVLGSAP